jgi:tripartite ATP-independent transporter DctP family solute receptor
MRNNGERKKHAGLKAAVILTAASVLLVSGCQVLPAGARKNNIPQYVFTYADNQTSDYPTTMGAMRFADLVKEKSGGRIIIEVHANAELGDEKSTTEQLSFGGIDMERVSLSTVADYSGMSQLLQMPYIYTGSEHMWKVLNSEIGRKVMDSFTGSGIVPLSWYDAGARNFYTTDKPIHGVADMKGMKIRVQQSAVMQDMVSVLGATPIPSTYEEVYSQLQKGDIDGAENNVSSYETMKHYEIAKYFTIDEHMRVPEMQAISQSTWDKLSEEDQTIIREAAEESAVYERTLWNEREKTAEQKVKDAGTEFIELTPEAKDEFRNTMLPLYAKYCGEYADLLEQIRAMGKE